MHYGYKSSLLYLSPHEGQTEKRGSFFFAFSSSLQKSHFFLHLIYLCSLQVSTIISLDSNGFNLVATAAVAVPTSALSDSNTTKEDKGKKLKNQLKKLRKKKQKQNRNQREKDVEVKKEKENVEVEYIVANLTDEIDRSDPNYSEFAGIFERFKSMAETKIEEEIPEQEEKIEEGQKNDEETDENGAPKLSKRAKKKLKRPSLAVLKQLVKRPDVVESWDVTAADPLLLVFLKSYRNTVPVPRHWNQKRRYLQGKRGIEKPPFQLPDFIAATGISKVRQAIQDRDAHKTIKQKQRDKMQAKVGRMDINYQVLHDAFFKYQTKPKLTYHGDLYYEGKEFEITLKEKKPGHLSEDLKRALGMPEGAPPPWLINMQRYVYSCINCCKIKNCLQIIQSCRCLSKLTLIDLDHLQHILSSKFLDLMLLFLKVLDMVSIQEVGVNLQLMNLEDLCMVMCSVSRFSSKKFIL